MPFWMLIAGTAFAGMGMHSVLDFFKPPGQSQSYQQGQTFFGSIDRTVAMIGLGFLVWYAIKAKKGR